MRGTRITVMRCIAMNVTGESCEAMAASQRVLWNVGSTWLFKSALDAMLLVNVMGRIAAVNEQAEKLFG